METMVEQEVRAVHAIAHHRNGVCGESFYVVTFTSTDGKAMLATVFEGSGRVAVLCVGLLAEGNIAFGENSWRGDRFEPELRGAIEAWEQADRQVVG